MLKIIENNLNYMLTRPFKSIISNQRRGKRHNLAKRKKIMTAQSKHTPAPWRYHKSEHDCEYIITGSNENGGSILPILGRTHNFPNNNEANARLIAAAPELLEALEQLSDFVKNNCDLSFQNDECYPAGYLEIEKSDKIIAKARGGNYGTI